MIRLKFERINRHLSMETLATVAGLWVPLISLIETRRYNPTDAQLDALGRALDIAPDLLLQEVVIPTTDERPRVVEARTEEVAR